MKKKDWITKEEVVVQSFSLYIRLRTCLHASKITVAAAA